MAFLAAARLRHTPLHHAANPGGRPPSPVGWGNTAIPLITIATVIGGIAALVTVSIRQPVSSNEGRIDVNLEQMRAADTPAP